MEIVMARLTESRLGRIEAVSVKDLKPNSRNARTHSKRQIKLIADSLKAFGFVNPGRYDCRWPRTGRCGQAGRHD
jgi:hypothetical protein